MGYAVPVVMGVKRLPEDDDHGLGLLGDAWAKAAQYWHDDMGRQFDAYHLTPLIREARSYLEARRRLTDVLDEAESSTSY